VSAQPGGTPNGLRRELRLRDLVFFNVCAVAALRWLGTAAHTGPGALLLWVFAALFFFVPSALVVVKLASLFPEEGGMYVWTRNAFGDGHAFLCSWLYFISSVLYYPSLLLAGVSMAAYVFGAQGAGMADQRIYALPATLVVLWGLLLVNLIGLRVAKWVLLAGGTSTFVIAAILVALAIAAGVHTGSATHFVLLPHAGFDTLNLWSQFALAFTGLELAPIMSGELCNPRRDIPRAALISGAACALFYIGGTAAMLVLAAPDAISPMNGLAQAGAAAATRLGHSSISVLFSVLISLGVGGQLCTYMAGNTRLPYAIGLDHYLPDAFARLHPRWHTPWVSLLVQGLAATLFLVMAQVGDTMRAAYQILVDMVLITTLIPFLYIFGAGLRFAGRIASLSGLLVTLLALALSIVPPPEAASAAIFELKVIGGTVLFGVAGWLVFSRYRAVAASARNSLSRQ
jgi:amino acid transporter